MGGPSPVLVLSKAYPVLKKFSHLQNQNQQSLLDMQKLLNGIRWLICLVFLKCVPDANKTKQK